MAGMEEDKGAGAGVLNTADSASVCFETALDTNDSECANPVTKKSS